MYDTDSPILNRPQASAAQCANYLVPRLGVDYTAHDVRAVIIPAYFTIAESVGVDPVLAIAQMCHETGHLSSWWCARPRRNPAGIGVTGAYRPIRPERGAWQKSHDSGIWYEGCAFATWQLAIAAHVGRLAAYASNEDSPLVLNALAVRALPARYRGCAPTLKGLGGTWAYPGKTYAFRLAVIANRICRVNHE